MSRLLHRVDDNDSSISLVVRFVSENFPRMSSTSFSRVFFWAVSARAGNIIRATFVLFIIAYIKYIAVMTISAIKNRPIQIFPVNKATPSSPGSTSQKLAVRIRFVIVALCTCVCVTRNLKRNNVYVHPVATSDSPFQNHPTSRLRCIFLLSGDFGLMSEQTLFHRYVGITEPSDAFLRVYNYSAFNDRGQLAGDVAQHVAPITGLLVVFVDEVTNPSVPWRIVVYVEEPIGFGFRCPVG